jgi:indole-3-glycerol phosphate synthase
MKNQLRRIIQSTEKKMASQFASFSPNSFSLNHRKDPINIFPLIDRKFFLIAEVKKGSPSKGIIRKNFNPLSIARAYERGGASAISVITEENHFFGKPEYLKKIRAEVKLPLLRKDFIIHPYQVYQSYNLGADIILLITACLSRNQINHLYQLTKKLGMQALIEVHTQTELKRVLELKPSLIGINNRDLNSFQVNFKTSLDLKKHIPSHIQVISESGIHSREQLKELRVAGFAGALIGEAILHKKDCGAALKEFIDD